MSANDSPQESAEMIMTPRMSKNHEIRHIIIMAYLSMPCDWSLLDGTTSVDVVISSHDDISSDDGPTTAEVDTIGISPKYPNCASQWARTPC
jgi:hypothetical protein